MRSMRTNGMMLSPAGLVRTRRCAGQSGSTLAAAKGTPIIPVLDQCKRIGCSPGKHPDTGTMAPGSDGDSRDSVHGRRSCISVWRSERPRKRERQDRRRPPRAVQYSATEALQIGGRRRQTTACCMSWVNSVAQSPRRDRPLSKTHAGHGNPLKETGGDDGAGWILLQLSLEFRQLVSMPEGVHRFPDDIVHEQAAAGDAAMKLGRDQTGLLSHDSELPFKALEKMIDLIGRNEKGAHENDRGDVVLKLLLEGDAIIEVDDLGCFPGRTLGIGGECRRSLNQRSKGGPDRSSLNKITARERHGESSSG